jgi:hypothetical protein
LVKLYGGQQCMLGYAGGSGTYCVDSPRKQACWQRPTCYPAIIPHHITRYMVYNYTWPLDGPDQPGGTALTVGTTLIYRMTLAFL